MASKRAKGRAGDAANRGNIFSGEKSPQNGQASNGKRAAAGAIEHFETRSKKGRGMARRSLDLIEAMYASKPHNRSPGAASDTSCSLRA